jgi:uncharacterized protein
MTESAVRCEAGAADGVPLAQSGPAEPRHEWARPGPVAMAALRVLRAYKLLVSPLFTGSCRYLPSCSDYAAEAIQRHGVAAGVGMSVQRLCRCHPFGGSGYDPVPESNPWRTRSVGTDKSRS